MLVMTSSSRRPRISSPRISSDRPSAYMSAQSKKLMPASNAWRSSGRRYRECSELAYYKRHHAIFGDERSLAAAERLRVSLKQS